MDTVGDTPAEIKKARINLLGAINGLRYSGGGIPTQPSLYETYSEPEFLDAITHWLYDFNKILIGVSETTTDMAEELYVLRNQRKAVRDFLGISSISENMIN